MEGAAVDGGEARQYSGVRSQPHGLQGRLKPECMVDLPKVPCAAPPETGEVSKEADPKSAAPKMNVPEMAPSLKSQNKKKRGFLKRLFGVK